LKVFIFLANCSINDCAKNELFLINASRFSLFATATIQSVAQIADVSLFFLPIIAVSPKISPSFAESKVIVSPDSLYL